MGNRNARARLILLVFLIVSLIQLLAIAADISLVRFITKILLMPLLIGVVLADGSIQRHPSLRWLVAGLFFAWLGDIALLSDASALFILGMLAFLCTHVCYIKGFLELGARDALRERKWVLVAYPLFWVICLAALIPNLGALAIPVAIYSAFLVTMAMMSMSLGTTLGIGGTLFMLSDGLIGATVAFGDFFGSGVLIMLTYIIGQMLITIEWLRLAAPVEVQVEAALPEAV